jgi:hypothetical protein
MVFPSIAFRLKKRRDRIVEVLHIQRLAVVGREREGNVLDADTNEVICYLSSDKLRAMGDLDEEYIDVKGGEVMKFVDLGDSLGKIFFLFGGKEIWREIESK